LCGSSGFGATVFATRAVGLVTACVTRYRKSLDLLQRFRIKTKVGALDVSGATKRVRSRRNTLDAKFKGFRSISAQ